MARETVYPYTNMPLYDKNKYTRMTLNLVKSQMEKPKEISCDYDGIETGWSQAAKV